MKEGRRWRRIRHFKLRIISVENNFFIRGKRRWNHVVENYLLKIEVYRFGIILIQKKYVNGVTKGDKFAILIGFVKR